MIFLSSIISVAMKNKGIMDNERTEDCKINKNKGLGNRIYKGDISNAIYVLWTSKKEPLKWVERSAVSNPFIFHCNRYYWG